jgi:PAS domain S-box-containing protein
VLRRLNSIHAVIVSMAPFFRLMQTNQIERRISYNPPVPSRVREALDVMTQRGEAVFAIDNTDRIVFWNEKCEKILGHPAQKVLGKYCFDVVGGRDENGNIYCYRNCPVAHQARDMEDEPVKRFTLTVKNGDGKERRIITSLFALPSSRAQLSTVVHVIREDERQAASPVEKQLARAAAQAPGPRWGMNQAEAPLEELTTRERDILRCLAEGLPTAAIARKLYISPVTVRNHVQNILQKLDVHTKLAAVVLAFRKELI